jgi:hypothetical protein
MPPFIENTDDVAIGAPVRTLREAIRSMPRHRRAILSE